MYSNQSFLLQKETIVMIMVGGAGQINFKFRSWKTK